MTNEMLFTIGIFFLLQVINVVLNTLKTLIMAKTDNKHASAIINAVTFGFYTAVVQQIGKMDLIITIPVTMVTNIIGVYLTYIIMDKARKDDLWKVEIYSKNIDRIIKALEKLDIGFIYNAYNVITVYCYTQAESTVVKTLIEQEKEIKYNITVITKKF